MSSNYVYLTLDGCLCVTSSNFRTILRSGSDFPEPKTPSVAWVSNAVSWKAYCLRNLLLHFQSFLMAAVNISNSLVFVIVFCLRPATWVILWSDFVHNSELTQKPNAGETKCKPHSIATKTSFNSNSQISRIVYTGTDAQTESVI